MRDPQPAITFSEEDDVRYLHFGSPWVQGAMRLSDPYALEIAYVRDMMAWLLFRDPPPAILQLGLGAASLTKFCHRHCRESAVTVVERSRVVIAAAHQWFALPRPDRRLEIVRADAGAYLRRPAVAGRFGVVQVDLIGVLWGLCAAVGLAVYFIVSADDSTGRERNHSEETDITFQS